MAVKDGPGRQGRTGTSQFRGAVKSVKAANSMQALALARKAKEAAKRATGDSEAASGRAQADKAMADAAAREAESAMREAAAAEETAAKAEHAVGLLERQLSESRAAFFARTELHWSVKGLRDEHAPAIAQVLLANRQLAELGLVRRCGAARDPSRLIADPIGRLLRLCPTCHHTHSHSRAAPPTPNRQARNRLTPSGACAIAHALHSAASLRTPLGSSSSMPRPHTSRPTSALSTAHTLPRPNLPRMLTRRPTSIGAQTQTRQACCG